MFFRVTTLIVAVLAGSVLLGGCGAWRAVSDSTASAYCSVFYRQVKVMNIDLSARALVNADEAGRSMSVAVRVYQLAERRQFDHASYDDLLKSDMTVLARDLRASAGVVVNPGGAASVSQPMEAATKYIAVVAFYRDPNANERWRRVVPRERMPADGPLKLELFDRELTTMADHADGLDD